MAHTVEPRGELGIPARVPIDDERELLMKGTQTIASNTAKQPILGSYLPVHPVHRYTYKKWDTDDWSRHNDSKFYQASQDREGSRV